MARIEGGAQVDRLVPMAHVEDLARSIAFYERLGFSVKNTVQRDGRLVWAWLVSDGASLMVALASGPIVAADQAVLFYLYTKDIEAFRAAIVARGIDAGPLTRPFYMPSGEVRIHDPDGYVLLVGQTG